MYALKSRTLLFAVLLFSIQSFADSLNVRQLGFYDPPGTAFNLALAGDYAYVATSEDGLRVVNVFNPAVPAEVGVYDTLSKDVAIAGTHAYIAASRGRGLRVVDITVPATPVETGFIITPGWASGVAVSGNYAYIADVTDGLRVIDVSNPNSPVEVGHCALPGTAQFVAVSGNYAYVGAGGSGLRIVDIAVPSAPVEVGFLDTPSAAMGVAVFGNYVYVADYTSLRIIHVATPQTPLEVGVYTPPGQRIDNVTVDWGYAFVAANSDGLRIVNCIEPTVPVEVGFYRTTELLHDVAVTGHLVYTAFGTSFRIFDCAAALGTTEHFSLHPSSFRLSSYPNPFNSSTTLRLDLPREVRGRLLVYDALGRNVATLWNGSLSAGSHAIPFDAQRMTSGTYFVRLESAAFTATEKMVLLK